MAIDVGAGVNWATVDSAPVTSYPLSIGLWMNPAATGTNGAMFYMGDKDATNIQYFKIYLTGANVPIFAVRAASSAFNATAGGSMTNNTWNHVLAVGTSATSRDIYLNGGNKGSNATNTTPVGADRITLGRMGDTTPSDYFNGR